MPNLFIDVEARFAQFQDSLNRVSKQVDSASGAMQKSLGRVSGAMAALGVGLSVAGLVAFAKSSIDAVAHLDDLSEKTSLSVERLSQLQEVARIGGHSLDEVAGAASKFAKSVSAAAGGNDELLRLFRQIGISADDLKNKSFDELFVKFATTIAGASDKTNALAVAMKLSGKSASEMLPFFNDLAERGLGVAKVTAEMAAQAERFQKNLAELSTRSAGARDALVGTLLPGLLRVSEEMKRSVEQGDNLLVVMAKIAKATFFGDKQMALERELFDLASRRLRREEELAEVEKGRNLAGPGTDKVLARLKAEHSANDERIAQLQKELKLIEERDKPKPKVEGRAVGAVADAGALSKAESEREKAMRRAEALLEKYRSKLSDIAKEQRKLDGVDSPFLDMKDLLAGKDFAEMGPAQKEALLNAAEQLGLNRDIARQNKELADGMEDVARESAQWRSKDITDLNDLKRKYMDLADPLQKYRDQLTEIARLSEAFPELNSVWTEAAFNINLAMDEAAGFNKTLKEVDETAREMGQAVSSAFEDAILDGKKATEVAAAFGRTIGQILLRQAVTKPLEKAIGGLDFGGILRGLVGGDSGFALGTEFVPRTGLALVHEGERIVPAGQGGGMMVVNNNHIDSRTDRAEIIAFIEQRTRQSVHSVFDSVRRGGGARRTMRG